MTLQVLLSCMHQKDASIIERSNIQTDVIIINQCNVNKVEELSFTNKKGTICHGTMISTTERGLSRSRNMAIQYATGDICLICDDDEVFEDDYEDKIIGSYRKYDKTDIIVFKLNHPTCTYPDKSHKIGILRTARVGSYQISFRRKDYIVNVKFCEKMGSGTGNGGGEENRFLVECIKKGAKTMYVPELIASVAQTESQWFHGYTERYWINRGWTSKMIFGSFLGYIYIWYTMFFRAYKYDKDNSLFNIMRWLHIGFAEKR